MKRVMIAGIVSLLVASPAFANCGHCGKGAQGQTAGAEEVHAGAQCSLHGEKNAVLLDAAKALETSHPELAGKLKDLAAHCCGEH